MHAAIEQSLEILVIEPEAAARQALVEGLQGAGHRIAPFADASECLRDPVSGMFDLAFIPQDAGTTRHALARLHQRYPRMRFVLTTDATRPEVGQSGQEVVGCVSKPVPVEYAQHMARCVAELRALEDDLADLRGSIGLAESLPIIHPHNTRMRRVADRARQLAGNPAPLLLCGEFGVGKRLLAGLIHQWGPHADSPCVVVRAASANPVSSPRDAAVRLRQSESGGTLVFEEIGEFTVAQQDEILGLIAVHDAGDDPGATLPRNVKIVATTSKDLSMAARKGEFREELLSLLMDETLYLPPLRERPEDIASMAERMLAYFGQLYHRPELSLEPEAKLALARYTWPGNVHELRNAIERVALTAKKPEIGESDFRLRPAPESGCFRSGSFLSLDATEKQQILRVMRASSTLEEAARILQVDISTLWRKRRRYGI